MLGDQIRVGGKVFERRDDNYTWDGWWLKVRILGDGVLEDFRAVWVDLRKISQGVEIELFVHVIIKPRENYTKVVEYVIDHHGLLLAATVSDPTEILKVGDAPLAPEIRHRVATTSRAKAYWHFTAPPDNAVVFEIFAPTHNHSKSGGAYHQYVDAESGDVPGEDLKAWVEERRRRHVEALLLFQQTFPPQNLKRPR